MGNNSYVLKIKHNKKQKEETMKARLTRNIDLKDIKLFKGKGIKHFKNGPDLTELNVFEKGKLVHYFRTTSRGHVIMATVFLVLPQHSIRPVRPKVEETHCDRCGNKFTPKKNPRAYKDICIKCIREIFPDY